MSQPAFPGRLNPGDPDLNGRQRAVFLRLIALHSAAADAVGSERIARGEGVRMSGASVRTALADLEEFGFLERGRHSAARVPTSRGYEFYVRTLLEPAVLPSELEDAIDAAMAESARDVESMLHDASRLLASLTHQLGLALASSLEEEPLSALDLEPLGEHRALLALGIGGRSARTLVLELGTALDRSALEQVEDVLRTRLLGRPLREVRAALAGDPELARDSAVRIVVRAAAASWTRPVETPLLAAGARHIASQPEFADPARLAPLLQAVESGEPLNRLLVDGIQGQVGVRIGLAGGDTLSSCSLVSFPLPGAIPGAVGVLGPMRMDYALTLAIVDRVGSRIAELLSA